MSLSSGLVPREKLISYIFVTRTLTIPTSGKLQSAESISVRILLCEVNLCHKILMCNMMDVRDGYWMWFRDVLVSELRGVVYKKDGICKEEKNDFMVIMHDCESLQ